MLNLLLLLSISSTSFLLTRLLCPRHRVEFLLTFTVILSTLIVLLGYATSGCNQLNQPGWWFAFSLVPLFGMLIVIFRKRDLQARCLRPLGNLQDLRQRFATTGMSGYEKMVLWLTAGTVIVTALANLVVVIAFEPATIDSNQYHLARIGYYLQHGNLHAFPANYWAQVVHAKVATVLMICAYFISGNINGTQLIQYFAYFVSMVAVYGITRHLGASRRGSLFATFIFALLIICLMEAATAQNDMVLTAFTGCSLYFFLASRTSPRVTDLCLAAVALALALGVKSTMLAVLPSLLLVVLLLVRPLLLRIRQIPKQHVAWAAVVLVLALIVITLPAGYAENIRLFGNPLGPASVNIRHSITGQPLEVVLQMGSCNLLRYGLDFLTLEGLLPFKPAIHLQQALHYLPEKLFAGLGIHLERGIGMRSAFQFQRYYFANENNAYWGILGFALVWPIVLIALFHRKEQRACFVFALAALLFYIVQAYISPYDCWRGRYFITAALFAVPPLAFYLFPARTRFVRGYVLLVVLLGCLSAVLAVTYRTGTYLLPFHWCGIHQRSSFEAFHYPGISGDQLDTLTRVMHMTRQDVDAFIGVATFEALVPSNAIVALDLSENVPEGYFFGNHFSRKLLPIRPFYETESPLDDGADYLVFDSTSTMNHQQSGDIPLYNWKSEIGDGTVFLRKR